MKYMELENDSKIYWYEDQLDEATEYLLGGENLDELDADDFKDGEKGLEEYKKEYKDIRCSLDTAPGIYEFVDAWNAYAKRMEEPELILKELD